ncbi:hypothetical protein ACWC9R_03355 [Streptomyces sp. NPDC001219]
MVAADAARLPVIPPERDGGQAQFIVQAHPTPSRDGSEHATGIRPRTHRRTVR